MSTAEMVPAATPDLLAAALDAAEQGWPVFPLVPGGKRPALHGAGRCPRTGTCRDGHQGWEQRATTDLDRIRAAWSTGAWNFGVATGPAALVVVDLDLAKRGEQPPARWRLSGARDGVDVLTCLAADVGQLPPFDTGKVITPSGGTHLYFRASEGIELRNTTGTLGWKVDTRAHGGYVVGAGSIVDGRRYEVADDRAPAPLPDWLVGLLRPAPLPAQRPVVVPLATDRHGSYLRAAVRAELDRVATSPPDGHNTALFRASVGPRPARRGRRTTRGRRDRLVGRSRHRSRPTSWRGPAHDPIRSPHRCPPAPDGGRVSIMAPRNRTEPESPRLRAVASGGSPVELQKVWAADELMATEFPEPRWAVPGVVAEGVSLLAGPPKVGKSWLSLGLGLTIAAGGQAFGRIDIVGGPVLYLALEDTPRRLQTRMSKILGEHAAPGGLTLATSCPALPQGGDEAIAAWLDRNADARMVVIDVFAKMRGHSPAGMSAYDADYAAVGRAKHLADTYGVAVVLVHHVRKAGADDFLAEVSGTNGLAGAADATLVLKRARGQEDGVLHVTGRDVDEAEYALSFQPASGSWLMLDGPAAEHTLTDTRAAILRHVRDRPGSTPAQIATDLGASRENVKRTCARMAEAGQLRAEGTGRYFAPDFMDGADGSVPAVSPVPRVPVGGLSGRC